MADERDQWLDKDTAERLLRGDSVESLDASAVAGAARVASALRDLALIAHANDAGGPGRRHHAAGSAGATGQTPGEAAAVAAFRRARQDRTSAHSGRAPRTEGRRLAGSRGDGGPTVGVPADGIPGAGAGRDDEDVLGTVRLAPVPATAARARWRAVGRALSGGQGRARGGGLAAVLAGCVLGSAAFAFGSGVLMAPASTGSHETPSPAVSPTGGPAPSKPGGGPDLTGTPGGPLPDGADAGPWERVGKRMLSLDGATGVAAGTGSTGGPSASVSAAGGGPSASPGSSTPADWYAAAVGACRALRDGTIDHRHRTMLVQLAKSEHGAAAFCARLLAGLPAQSGGASAGPSPSESGGFGVYDPGGSTASGSPPPVPSPPGGNPSTTGPNGQPSGGTSSAPAPSGTGIGATSPPAASPSASPDASSSNGSSQGSSDGSSGASR